MIGRMVVVVFNLCEGKKKKKREVVHKASTGCKGDGVLTKTKKIDGRKNKMIDAGSVLCTSKN